MATLGEARKHLEIAAEKLFQSDPCIQSVGVTRAGSDFQFRAVRHREALLPQNSFIGFLADVDGIGVNYASAPDSVRSQVLVTAVGPARPAATSALGEVLRQRPLVSGLEIQNIDDDLRQIASGAVPAGIISVGTLGCMVTLDNGSIALLSNNHVIAGSNRGRKAADRIQQAGSATHVAADQVAVLHDFVALSPSAAGATPASGVVYNDVDAATAVLAPGLSSSSGYLSYHGKASPTGSGTALPGDKVFKIGRTTGLTEGEVTSVSAIVGPIAYAPGPCWFRNAIEIEGINGTLFSNHGDSGAVVVKASGEIIGLLFAGNGKQTYICPIADVLTQLQCTFP